MSHTKGHEILRIKCYVCDERYPYEAALCTFVVQINETESVYSEGLENATAAWQF